MPHVSRNPLEPKTQNSIWNLFIKVLSNTKSPDKLGPLLQGILTPTEKVMLSKRVAALFLFDKGYSDSEISNQLHLTRMSVQKFRLLWEKQSEAQNTFNQILKNPAIRKLVTGILKDLLIYLAASTGGRLPRYHRRRS